MGQGMIKYIRLCYEKCEDSNMSKLERKLGKYAIPNLTVILLLCYVVGYIIQLVNGNFLDFLTLNPYLILKGQVWRLVTWIVIPPSSLDMFTLIMLLFYYSIGTMLERTWGTYRYNVYIFSGIIFTVLGSFLAMGTEYLMYGNQLVAASHTEKMLYFGILAYSFGTHYICLSIYLAYAATYPDAMVLFMFFIPVKMKWMGIFNLILLVISFINGNLYSRCAIGAALLTFGIFYFTNIKRLRSPKQIKRQAQFKQEVRRPVKITRHKCAICGRTDVDSPDLEFRFCSKCNGNYQYCQDHLFTHEHVK